MRRNKIKSGLEKNYKRNIKKNILNEQRKERLIIREFQDEDMDIVDIIKNQQLTDVTDVTDSLNYYDLSPINHIEQSVFMLKNLAHLLKYDDVDASKKDNFNINAFDPTLNFRFLHRQSTKNIFLPPIKTRFSWQNGEFPFFKIEARHYNHEKLQLKNQKIKKRGIKSTAIQNIATGEYYDMEYPTDIWPCKGTLYISNLRLLFKRPTKENLYIEFENIISYSFYNNAVVIEHLEYEYKLIDVFYIETEQARLLETIINITL